MGLQIRCLVASSYWMHFGLEAIQEIVCLDNHIANVVEESKEEVKFASVYINCGLQLIHFDQFVKRISLYLGDPAAGYKVVSNFSQSTTLNLSKQ